MIQVLDKYGNTYSEEGNLVVLDKYGNIKRKNSLTSSAIITALGYTPENVANKTIDFSIINDTLYPSVKAVKDYIDSNAGGIKGFHRIQSPNFSPAANTTYYFGGNNLGVLTSARTNNSLDRVYAMATGLIKKISVNFSAGLAAGPPNALTISINNITLGTTEVLTTSLLLNTNRGFINVDISPGLVINKNDALTLRVTTPAWGSNPTNVNFWAEFTIE